MSFECYNSEDLVTASAQLTNSLELSGLTLIQHINLYYEAYVSHSPTAHRLLQDAFQKKLQPHHVWKRWACYYSA